MPWYEYRCRTCDTTFERRRGVDEANDPIACAEGHLDTVRLLSVFASTRAAASPAPAGGCGAGCACAHS